MSCFTGPANFCICWAPGYGESSCLGTRVNKSGECCRTKRLSTSAGERERESKTKSLNPGGARIITIFSRNGKYSKCYLFAAASLAHHVTKDPKMLYKENYFSVNFCGLGLKGGIHFLLLFKIIRFNKPDKFTLPKHCIWTFYQNKFCRTYLSTFLVP